MTKIEEQRAVIFNLLAIGDNAANELLDKFEAAIQEQVVLDALPSDEEIDKLAYKEYHEAEDSRWFEPLQIGMKQMRSIATQRLTTREEVAKQIVLDGIQPIIRNQLSPMSNLIALLENSPLMYDFDVEKHKLIEQEITQCKNSIKFLSTHTDYNITTREEVERPFVELLKGLRSLMDQSEVDKEYINTWMILAENRITAFLKEHTLTDGK